MIVNVSAVSNERLFIPILLTNWAAAYPLDIATFWGQVRKDAKLKHAVIDFTREPATLSYDTSSKMLTFSEWPGPDKIPGEYVWDFGFTIATGPVRIGGGYFSIARGVTRHGAM